MPSRSYHFLSHLNSLLQARRVKNKKTKHSNSKQCFSREHSECAWIKIKSSVACSNAWKLILRMNCHISSLPCFYGRKTAKMFGFTWKKEWLWLNQNRVNTSCCWRGWRCWIREIWKRGNHCLKNVLKNTPLAPFAITNWGGSSWKKSSILKLWSVLERAKSVFQQVWTQFTCHWSNSIRDFAIRHKLI